MEVSFPLFPKGLGLISVDSISVFSSVCSDTPLRSTPSPTLARTYEPLLCCPHTGPSVLLRVPVGYADEATQTAPPEGRSGRGPLPGGRSCPFEPVTPGGHKSSAVSTSPPALSCQRLPPSAKTQRHQTELNPGRTSPLQRPEC